MLGNYRVATQLLTFRVVLSSTEFVGPGITGHTSSCLFGVDTTVEWLNACVSQRSSPKKLSANLNCDSVISILKHSSPAFEFQHSNKKPKAFLGFSEALSRLSIDECFELVRNTAHRCHCDRDSCQLHSHKHPACVWERFEVVCVSNRYGARIVRVVSAWAILAHADKINYSIHANHNLKFIRRDLTWGLNL
jgi:hypothetical protein